MRVLFVFEAGDGTIFPYVPLAQAVRGAGHEVLTATHAGAVPTLLTAGLPAVANSSRAPRDYRTATDGSLIPLPADPVAREEELGRLGAMIGIDAHAGLQDVIVHWRPDVVVGCAGALAGPLAAAQAGVPLVRFAVDIGEIPLREVSALEHLRRSGHPDLPDPALSLTTWPLSIRPADVAPAEPIRHVPYATPRPFEPWMFVKGERPRVLVSAGSRVSRDYAIDHVSDMIRAGSQLNAELLIAEATRNTASDTSQTERALNRSTRCPEAGMAAQVASRYAPVTHWIVDADAANSRLIASIATTMMVPSMTDTIMPSRTTMPSRISAGSMRCRCSCPVASRRHLGRPS
ncbi:glycosyltransferase family protein [Salinispora vitiensis]